jgi:HlyD family secretion protein
VREGQTAEMTVGNTKKPLVVTKVLPNVEAGKFRVELGGSGLSGQIRLGQNVPVRILLSKASQSITIPVGPYLDETGGQFVFVLSPDGSSAERRRVRLGARSDRQIVVEQGLSAGERVIISSYKEFEQYDRVRFH